MAQAKRGSKSTDGQGRTPHPGVLESAFFLLAALAFYLFLALITFDPADSAWSHSSGVGVVENAGGVVGAWFADLSLYLFGFIAILFPLAVAHLSWWLWSNRSEQLKPEAREIGFRSVGFVLTLVAGSSICALRFNGWAELLPMAAGGVLGGELARLLAAWLNPVGAMLLLVVFFLSGVTLLTRLSWLKLIDWLGVRVARIGERLGVVLLHTRDYFEGRRERSKRKQSADRFEASGARKRKPRIEPVAGPVKKRPRTVEQQQIPMFGSGSGLPALSLLDDSGAQNVATSSDVLEALSRRVELKLAEFGVQVEVVAVKPGPVVTRFEMETAPGVKVSQIVGLVKDMARALSVISVRVVENIPGSSLIGLEIPNEQREMVRLGELLRSAVYNDSKSALTLALGKDTEGLPMVTDLGRMPHLLVAGTTGSGKSVAINAMILSLLYKAGPEDIRLIMIDPKMLELSVYDGIPHLLAPVVTDMNDANRALRWCVAEMERRYRLMATLGVRNLAGFNRKVRDAIEAGEPLIDPIQAAAQPPDDVDGVSELPTLEPLPHIVVVVDELADMMMLVGKKVEQLIARLAQKARASGVHLILATQRPSVDVLTGLIKANIPARIAFQVSSKIDSRTILDQMGAEQLLGHGDMLYLPPGTSLPVRVHGAFVADDEVHRVVKALKKQPPPAWQVGAFDEESEQATEAGGGGGGSSEDEFYDKAVALVARTRKASISSVQRHLRIGYNRAARLVEEMEEQGVLSSVNHNGTREVLIPALPEE